eukprot:TRINITY_DN11775_c0_g1_i1.p1 TRINITY_DN11775_c0_g1~~TRINITY_DN11775_c0_g1_i1.p1  ORF type:complete len:258 (-),score=51.47 TRINITY_DN11775_c0_g1_i1:350-1123(-)
MEGSAAISESELISKTLQAEQKFFYFDLKENPRGRYLKISEKTSGSRNTIIVPVDGIPWFIDIFTYYVDGAESNPVCKELQLNSKVFYFDIGVNKRGRFLKVSEASVTHNRSTIIVPAGDANKESWAAFRDILADINEASQQASGPSEHLRGFSDDVGAGFLPGSAREVSYVSDSEHDKSLNMTSENMAGENPVSRIICADKKKFFLDLGSNTRGQYVKISEVIGTDRSTIIVPVSALDQFHDALGQFIDIAKRQRQ